MEFSLTQSINNYEVDKRQNQDSFDDEGNRRASSRRGWVFKIQEEGAVEADAEGEGEGEGTGERDGEGEDEEERWVVKAKAKAKAILEKQTDDNIAFKHFCRWLCYEPQSKQYRVAFQEQKTREWLEKQPFIDSKSLRIVENGRRGLDQIRKTFPWLLYNADTDVDTLTKSLNISKRRPNVLTEEDRQQLIKDSQKLQEWHRIISRREQLVTEREHFVAGREQFLLNFNIDNDYYGSSREADIFSQFRTDLINGEDIDEILAKIVTKEEEDPQLMVVFTKFYPLLERLARKNQTILGKRHAPQLYGTIPKQLHGSQETGSRKISDEIDIYLDEQLLKEQEEEEGVNLRGLRKVVQKGKNKKEEHQSEILQKEMFAQCGRLNRKDVEAFKIYRETEEWKMEYKALRDFIDDAAEKEKLRNLIEVKNYDPVYYILTMKYGWYDYNKIKASVHKGSDTLKEIFSVCGDYYKFYADTNNVKITRWPAKSKS